MKTATRKGDFYGASLLGIFWECGIRTKDLFKVFLIDKVYHASPNTTILQTKKTEISLSLLITYDKQKTSDGFFHLVHYR